MKSNNIMSSVRIFFLSIYIIGIFGLTNIYTNAQSQSRNTYTGSDIKIIPRSDRGADNGRLLRGNKLYDATKKRLKIGEYAPKTNPQSNNTGKVVVPKKSNSQIADEYIVAKYPEEYKLDGYITKIDDKELFWPISIKNKKTKIIIHHTAGELQEGIADGGVLDKLVDILKFHTFTRGWGDIGYNFLIGPAGYIYEGRVGGTDAVGANATFNNTESVGISLMGNYNLNAPNPEQYMSLIKLIISIAKKYNINVYDRKIYHKASKDYPYVIDVEHDSIAGHTDAGNTSCPGKYIYEDMDYIKFAVDKGIGAYDIMISTQYILSNSIQNIPLNISYLNRYNANFKNRVSNSKGLSCKSDDDKIDANCEINGDQINMTIKNKGYDLNSIYNIKISNDKGEWYNIYMRLVGYSDGQAQYSKLQSTYENKFGKASFPATYSKIDSKIQASETVKLLQQDISIMLYDLSTSYDKYSIKCTKGCSIDIYNDGGKIAWDKISTLDIDTKSSDKINIYYNEQIYKADKIIVNQSDNNGLTQFTNYKRNSSSKTPRNIFSGNIIIEKQNIRKLDGKRYNQRSVINKLPLHDYVLGIAESNDNEPYEKVKMMTILSKQYALYYMNHQNEHLYISSGSNFVLTDDPRISQKYIGAGFVSKKRKQAVAETRNQVVVYDNFLPILPYFSCSAGFTRGASKFGRNDTPYLVGKLDPWGYCDDGKGNFAGHGVGASGKGANVMAKKGYDYKQILQYYYDGTSVQEIGNNIYKQNSLTNTNSNQSTIKNLSNIAQSDHIANDNQKVKTIITTTIKKPSIKIINISPKKK